MKERTIKIPRAILRKLSGNPWAAEEQINRFCDRIEEIAGFDKVTAVPDRDAGVITIISEE